MDNGDIITNSESDADPDVVSKANTPFDDSIKTLIRKKRASIKLQADRMKAKQISKQNFLRRKVSRNSEAVP